MFKPNIYFFILPLFSIALMATSGCESTKLVSSWKSEQFPEEVLSRIAVIALMQDLAYRRAFENSLTSMLQNSGVNATSGLVLFPIEKKYTKEEMENIFQQKNITAIFIVADAGSEKTKEYVPGNNYPYNPMYNYYGYYNYYDPYRYRQDQGYYRETQYSKIEGVIFDHNTDKMIWSAVSQTTDPGSLVEFAGDVSSSFISKLKSDKILK